LRPTSRNSSDNNAKESDQDYATLVGSMLDLTIPD
jgi:hypothetical protein